MTRVLISCVIFSMVFYQCYCGSSSIEKPIAQATAFIEELFPKLKQPTTETGATVQQPNEKQQASDFISFNVLQQAAQAKGKQINQQRYQDFQNSLQLAGINDKKEATMYLTHTCWESDGFSTTKEAYCQNPNNRQACINAYGQSPATGKIYYGRGYIQTSHNYNYERCSNVLYHDPSVLLDNPDIVENDENIAWGCASVYWKYNVHDVGAPAIGFGATTRQINGPKECDNGPDASKGRARFELYSQLLKSVDPNATPNPAGC